jgi:hypothetical protein
MTNASLRALDMLRDPSMMKWYVVPLLVFVVYVYITEIERKNWSGVYLGLSLFFLELTWEIGNALLLPLTGHSALWTVNGQTAYLIYVGYSIEIAFFFAVAGILVVKALPEDKNLKIMAIPNRVFIPVAMGLAGLFVEVLLNRAGILVWEYWFWRFPNLFLLALGYCLPWFAVAWAHDNLSLVVKKRLALSLAGVAILLHVLFVQVLQLV